MLQSCLALKSEDCFISVRGPSRILKSHHRPRTLSQRCLGSLHRKTPPTLALIFPVDFWKLIGLMAILVSTSSGGCLGSRKEMTLSAQSVRFQSRSKQPSLMKLRGCAPPGLAIVCTWILASRRDLITFSHFMSTITTESLILTCWIRRASPWKNGAI